MIAFSLTKRIRRDYQPKRSHISKWLRASLIYAYKNVYIDISIVSLATSQALNLQYRQKNSPTNIIALEYANPGFAMLCGELILCDEVIVQEAVMQHKNILEHYTHLVIHGILHLQGLDHIKPNEALHMENLEKKILHQLGIKDPYVVMEE